jgi:undecaprenyl-diphosphatase
MDFSIKTNLKNIIDMFFLQITELGSLSIITTLIIIMYFFEKTVSIKLFIGIVIITLIAMIIKALFFKVRPKKQKTRTFIERLDASSFPSIHSARITFLTFSIIAISTSLILTIFLIILGILIAYSRIYLKKHYLFDVIAGIVLGLIVIITLAYLM